MLVMKRMIATAAVCGVSLFGLTAVAGAAPGNPSANLSVVLLHNAAPCAAVSTNNPTLNLPNPPLGVTLLEGVGAVLCSNQP